MRTHLVAGAAGFLGSHLVDRILAEGDRVVAVDNCLTGSVANLAHLKPSRRYRYIQHDVTLPLVLDERVEFVWNLASPASPPEYMRLPLETLRVGSVGTENLLQLAREHDARFFLASTSEVYGDPDISPQPESYWGRVNPVGPRSVYDEAKRYAEALTTAYRTYHGVDTVIVRIFNTYGPRMRLDDGRVVPNFIGQALRGEPLTVYGDGSQTRSFCFVEDEIDGFWRLMMSDETGPMNIGNPREMTMMELAKALEAVVGHPLPLSYRPLPKDDPKQRRPDITLARERLGWEPKVPLEEGLRRTYEWFAQRQTVETVAEVEA
ncbi:MAG TPA: UDP-glucuronic acid decarboxylase family protein [Candidatus Thermoplasmatota archaeon]|nr:UDP-glucuronic acid decarboxylase family protein [Candidatus Thermoplasmatota archaeon]